MKIHVSLEEAGVETPRTFSFSVELAGEHVRCTIGTVPDVDLQLPRGDYPQLGRRQLDILLDSTGAQVRNLAPLVPCELNGEPIEDQTIGWGSHDLTLADCPFTLVLKTTK